jgi:hypothetical protein
MLATSLRRRCDGSEGAASTSTWPDGPDRRVSWATTVHRLRCFLSSEWALVAPTTKMTTSRVGKLKQTWPSLPCCFRRGDACAIIATCPPVFSPPTTIYTVLRSTQQVRTPDARESEHVQCGHEAGARRDRPSPLLCSYYRILTLRQPLPLVRVVAIIHIADCAIFIALLSTLASRMHYGWRAQPKQFQGSCRC